MYLAVAVVVGVVALLNLVLTFGVIRRLREHTDQLSRVARPAEDAILPAGTTIGDFTVTTVDGEVISSDRLGSRTLVGFFSPGCPACETLLPTFVEYAATVPGGRQRVLAVVAGESDGASEHVEKLRGSARVVRAGYEDAVMTAFGVKAFPGVCMIEADGTIEVAGGNLAGFPAPAAV
ncbi:redoxin domain-containing protein [Micromonospora cathayae]|uniref:Redoxin domain-containing protein n=1 Tax=Micromonospora cathayae TaxID=3028804 RepID=A0ABY7ZLK7_9ACTN|nr:redoxin domain-containing protein [Micromonospora sp. HUAS 3]WDZ82859.1 redoxin domain-containing protein [Micromonospora sp. HUAS 3]